MQKHPKKERTLVIIKPDGIQRTLTGEIISRFERIGLKIVGIKMLIPTSKHVEAHYTLDPNWRKGNGEKSIKAYEARGLKHPLGDDPLVVNAETLRRLKEYMVSGPIIPIVIEGAHAVAVVRKLVGGTEPLTSDVGTIRGDFVLDSYQMSDTDSRSVRNLIHASGSVGEAEMEIPHWFRPEELVSYRHIQEAMLYDVNIDGILE
ncbi:MAG: nucleoside-diphosphate kinase [Candidatus Taylorbacteria bacterium CG10_big_fil_rev_8_21_14_0_10_41_48]|uniref:nucleoside-diphosphate kinase n=1 Tax=Candidatus Taylorbacteria bacterium CG10_big_fil_rev_8_21_14_0_10_41_48 TaxID=1975024 RepID=A0A2M8LD20_9BACT|nr:MAG: nucleoside-diphosphate kinase [Candidatus Taylorbacteria bacterium CG10_big_fil_rev_8_21_14_0_10_41_48]